MNTLDVYLESFYYCDKCEQYKDYKIYIFTESMQICEECYDKELENE